MDEDNRRKNFIDHLNDAYGASQNANLLNRLSGGRLGKLGSKGIKAARGLGTLGEGTTMLLGGSLLGTIGIVAIFTIIIIVFIFGGQGAAFEIPPQKETQTIDVTNAFTSITNGDSVSDDYFYNDILGEAFSYLGYTGLITRNGPFTVEFNVLLGEEENICARAYVLKPSTIKLFGFSRCSLGDQRYLALHESGHVIGNRNVELYKSFPHLELIRNDRNCYSTLGHIKSYFYAESERGDITAYNESFAEAIAMYIIRNKRPFKDFRQECPATSAWAAENIFK